MAEPVVDFGPLQKRASSLISNVRLFDLIEDMAKKLDKLPRQFSEIHGKLDMIVEKLGAKS